MMATSYFPSRTTLRVLKVVSPSCCVLSCANGVDRERQRQSELTARRNRDCEDFKFVLGLEDVIIILLQTYIKSSNYAIVAMLKLRLVGLIYHAVAIKEYIPTGINGMQDRLSGTCHWFPYEKT